MLTSEQAGQIKKLQKEIEKLKLARAAMERKLVELKKMVKMGKFGGVQPYKSRAAIQKEITDIERRLKLLDEKDVIGQKQQELRKLLAKYRAKGKKVAEAARKDANITLAISIISLVFCMVPVASTIGAIVAVVRANKGKRYGLYPGKFKTAKIIGVIGIVLSVMLLIAIILATPNKTFEIDGEKVELVCRNSACEELDEYGDRKATQILAEIGVRKIDGFSAKADSPDAVIVQAYDSKDGSTRLPLVVTYNPDHTKVMRVVYQDFPDLVYYNAVNAANAAAQTVPFPSLEKIAEKRKAAEEEAAQQRAEEEAKAKAAAEAKAAEDARYPSETDTREFCEAVFHKQYPYKGSKVHSILGVVALERKGENQMFYKVNVTIQNAYGASYDQVLECTVHKDQAEQKLRIDEFVVY